MDRTKTRISIFSTKKNGIACVDSRRIAHGDVTDESSLFVLNCNKKPELRMDLTIPATKGSEDIHTQLHITIDPTELENILRLYNKTAQQ